MATVSGWPNRAGRNNFGVDDMEDERRTVDSRKEFNADQANLLFGQDGALGLIAPKAVFLATDTTLIYGAFSWDQTRYFNETSGGWPSYFTIVATGTGIITFNFASTVLGRPDDVTGTPQSEPLTFAMGHAQANLSSSGNRTRTTIVRNTAISFTTSVIRDGTGAIDQPVMVALF